MPSHNGIDQLKCESYTTTPRSTLTSSRLGKSDKDVSEDASVHSATPKDRVRSAPSHFSTHLTESLTERLVDNSEQWSLDDCLISESAVHDDWSEAAFGWRIVTPYAKYVTGKALPRNK